MDDKYIVWAEIKGKKFPLCLTVGAADELEKAFGGIQAIGQSVTDHANKDELGPMLHTILSAFLPLAKAGKDYLTARAAFSGEKAESTPDVPEEDVLRSILSGTEIVENILPAVTNALNGGSSRDVEVAPDNSAKNGETAM